MTARELKVDSVHECRLAGLEHADLCLRSQVSGMMGKGVRRAAQIVDPFPDGVRSHKAE